MDNKKVVKLCDRDDRAHTWSVKDSLEYAIKEIEKEPQFNKKAILLFLDDTENDYNIRQITAGISKTSECVTILDVAKVDSLKDMGR